MRILNANKSENDILLGNDLNRIVNKSKGKIQTTFVLSHPRDKEKWEKNSGFSGHVNEELIKNKLFEPGEKSVVFLCGLPGMIRTAALPALKGELLRTCGLESEVLISCADWGYEEDVNCFGF